MTIFRKSLVTLALAAFVLTSALIISVLVFMNSLYYETNARALSNTASALFSVYSRERLCNFFTDIKPEQPFPYSGTQYRLSLIEKTGEVLWDSRVTDRMVNHLDREEVRAALEGREGRALRNSLSTGTKQLYNALPVKNNDGGVVGVFRLSAEVPGFRQRVSPAVIPFLFLAGILVCIGYLGILNFSRSLSRSLERLVTIARDGGEFRYTEIDMGESQEIITLERALRSMSAELKFRLAEARTEGARLEAILNSMSEAVIAADNNLFLLMVNPGAKTLFNLEEQKIPDMSLLEATRSTELELAARKVLESGIPEETELCLYSGGPEQHYHVSISPFSSEKPLRFGATGGTGGACPGIVIVMEDLTRITRLEQIRKDFVANVSHELRTPIQLIKGFSEIVLDLPVISSEDKEMAELRHYIGIIRKNANAMENLIGDLLSLASLEDNSSIRGDREELFLAPLFAEASALVELQAKKNKTEIVVDCPPDLAAKLYGTFIIQALVNLLDNAIKYSPEASRVYARAFQKDNCLVLEVQDRGIGIPGEHQERVFERFYRVDKARSKEAGGTGLGLSIVRHIALLHGGKAELESRAGEGSVFRVIIPE